MRMFPSLVVGTAVMFVAGALATAPLVTSGCGGCGFDDVAVSISPSPPSCLEVTAKRGWGCFSGGVLDGENRCGDPLTISKAGTELAADLVVAPGAPFHVDVMGDPGFLAPSFAFQLGNQPLTVSVAW